MATPANSLDISQAGLVKFDGVNNFTGVTVTNHDVLIGAASNGITSVAGTTNTVLIGNTGSDPSFSTVPAGALPGSGAVTLSNGTNVTITGSPLSLGGTATVNVSGPPSATTLTSHGIVLGQGTSAVTTTSAGSAGQILRSGGASSDPSYSTAVYPATASTSGNILTSNGTDWISSAPAYTGTVTSVSGTTNRITSTGGVTPVIDIAGTYVGQSSITTLGTIATGTWAGTTVAANHGGTGTISNTNHGVLIGQGTSAIVATSAGTSGQILQSGGSLADPSYSTATYPSTASTSGNVMTSDGINWISSSLPSSACSFAAYLASNDNSVTGDGTQYTVGTAVSFTKLFDTGTNFNINGTFTAPATGKYFFHGIVKLNNLSSSDTSGTIFINTTSTSYQGQTLNPGAIKDINNLMSLDVTSVALMTAGDTATMQIKISGSTKTVNLAGSTDPISRFSGYRIA